jgi:restriction system protein
MAKLGRRRTGELMRGVFEILMQEPDGLQAKEVIQRLQDKVPPTPVEEERYEANPQFQRYDKNVRFSTISVVKAGWLVKSKGYWFITDAGKQAYAQFPDPNDFAREASRFYRQWKQEQPEEERDDSQAAEIETDDEAIKSAGTLEEAQEAAWAEISEHMGEMPPYDFQELVSGLLVGMGYHVYHQAPPGPDGGVDIIAHTDPLGIHGPRIKLQVKRRADRLSVDEIRAFLAVLSQGDVGIFVSTGGFTKDAESEARHQETRRIMLLDLERLFDLWVEHYAQIPKTASRLLPLRPVYYLDLSD